MTVGLSLRYGNFLSAGRRASCKDERVSNTYDVYYRIPCQLHKLAQMYTRLDPINIFVDGMILTFLQAVFIFVFCLLGSIFLRSALCFLLLVTGDVPIASVSHLAARATSVSILYVRFLNDLPLNPPSKTQVWKKHYYHQPFV